MSKTISSQKNFESVKKFFPTELLSLSGRIETHDLLAKTKLLVKWVGKGHDVRVIISKDGCDPKKIDTIVQEITQSAGSNAKVTQKKLSGSDVRFSLIAVKEPIAPTK